MAFVAVAHFATMDSPSNFGIGFLASLLYFSENEVIEFGMRWQHSLPGLPLALKWIALLSCCRCYYRIF